MDKKANDAVLNAENEQTTSNDEPKTERQEQSAEQSGKPPKKSFKTSLIGYLKNMPKRWFITAFSGMAQGLFCTLIAGTILSQIAKWIGANAVGNFVGAVANIAKSLMGVGIGVGIANALKANKLVIFTAAVTGFAGAWAKEIIGGTLNSSFALGKPGNPIGAYVVTILTVEIAALYAGKTKLDIILIPLGMMAIALGAVYVAFPFIWLIDELGLLIAAATGATPFVMGVVISVIMGVLLTMPTSSAAIWVAVASPVIGGFAAGTVGSEAYEAILLAGGAATVGCACHMLGFAVASFKENGVGGLISQGIGTSMLQIPNIMKKPIIMLPMIVSSAITGPLATCVFKLKCGASGGGMGTSGLVGIFDLFDYTKGALGIVGIILLMIVLPIVLNVVFSEIMRKLGWIKYGDMKLES